MTEQCPTTSLTGSASGSGRTSGNRSTSDRPSRPRGGGANSTSTKLCLGGEIVEIPKILLEDETIFRSVLNKNAFWALSDPAKEHLRRFLPLSQYAPRTEQESVLDCAFTSDENFCFGSPLSKIYKKIQSGYFSAPHAADQVQLRDHRRVLYDHYIRHYYMNLLKTLLINRHKILEHASRLGPTDALQVVPGNYFSARKLTKTRELHRRAHVRARRMVAQCKKDADDPEPSSDESEEEIGSMPATSIVQSTVYSKKFSAHDVDLHQPIRIKSVNELLKEYQHLRETEPDCPSLDITDITLEEVYERSGISFQSEKNFAQMVTKKHMIDRPPSSVNDLGAGIEADQRKVKDEIK